MKPIRLLIVSGSERAGSYNRSLARVAAAAARRDGCEVDRVRPARAGAAALRRRHRTRPGRAPAALQLRDALHAHDALLMVTPEYNAFPTPLVLNAFDWMSRIPASAPGGGGRRPRPTSRRRCCRPRPARSAACAR